MGREWRFAEKSEELLPFPAESPLKFLFKKKKKGGRSRGPRRLRGSAALLPAGDVGSPDPRAAGGRGVVRCGAVPAPPSAPPRTAPRRPPRREPAPAGLRALVGGYLKASQTRQNATSPWARISLCVFFKGQALLRLRGAFPLACARNGTRSRACPPQTLLNIPSRFPSRPVPSPPIFNVPFEFV